jgi:hypothetical protein
MQALSYAKVRRSEVLLGYGERGNADRPDAKGHLVLSGLVDDTGKQNKQSKRK